MAALCSEVWQKRKRTSLRDFVNAYLVAILSVLGSEGLWGSAVDHVAVCSKAGGQLQAARRCCSTACSYIVDVGRGRAAYLLLLASLSSRHVHSSHGTVAEKVGSAPELLLNCIK